MFYMRGTHRQHQLGLFSHAICNTCRYKRIKHRVAGIGTGLKFRMKLARNKERMVGQFYNFRQFSIRTDPRYNHARIRKA